MKNIWSDFGKNFKVILTEEYPVKTSFSFLPLSITMILQISFPIARKMKEITK